MENIIIKPKEKSELDYIEFNITKTICDEIYFKNFNFELFGLEENPILTIRDNIEKRIRSLKKRTDRLLDVTKKIDEITSRDIDLI